MKIANSLACLLVGVITSASRAEDAKPQPAVKIVNETKIFKLDDSRNIGDIYDIHRMCLSPEAETLLYVQRIPPAKPDNPRGFRLVLRNIKTAKDTVLPGAPVGATQILFDYISMNPFNATGNKLTLPIAIGPADRPLRPTQGMMQLGCYDLKTGKIKKLDLTATIILPSYDAAGKNLIVQTVTFQNRRPACKTFLSPADKINFKQSNIKGTPRKPCPEENILPVLIRPESEDNVLILYDTKANKHLLRMPLYSGIYLSCYNPQWTTNGRYLYYNDCKIGEYPDGKIRRTDMTRIWDRKKNVELPIIKDAVPIGPAPGGSMILVHDKETRYSVHNPATAKTSPLLNDGTRLINANGRFLLYVKKDKDGAKSVYRAEIK